jgi:hypothetical protein
MTTPAQTLPPLTLEERIERLENSVTTVLWLSSLNFFMNAGTLFVGFMLAA